VRLVRTGFRFEAFSSTNGTSWTSIGVETVPMTDPVFVGLAVTSHTVSSSATAVFDHLTISSSTPTNKPPTVSLTAPAAGATFTAPATINLAATASDPENQLARVEFYQGSTLIATDTASPYTATWTSAPAGTFALTAVAVDAAGNRTTSAPVSVTVNATTNKPPTVSLTAPAAGATFTAPATISLAATASDPENQLARVEFYRSGTLISSDTAAPYTATWSSAPGGTYSLTAVAVDAAGNRTTSAAVSITVNAAAAAAPRLVVFHASADHATLVTSYRFDVFANGANPSTATPIASSDLGKPTPDANGDITVDRSSFFTALAPGTYVATVSAVGAGGIGRSAPATFTR
jgi:predicted phage tail protein